ncbi:hypothetical protein [Phytopseudomonas punonensis]|uniref:Bacteriophage replication gene A protein (GPA) n=1 Tax=Phytopseudomonas punonensis TaxID=1220495 RepID=A0A1M7MFS0_9GAMM|nr:hypothetical protein [Pseudomonas punonensis]SHM89740.1 Bacteriophage replication gene A protein (GPA) [Pseudomonas punonensis]
MDFPQESHPGESLDYSFGFLSFDPSRLPPLHMLSVKQTLELSMRISGCFQDVRPSSIKAKGSMFFLDSNVYGILVLGKSIGSVISKAGCRKYWRKILEKRADLARLDFEARNRVVGGIGESAQIYASDVSVERIREKAEFLQKYLEGKVLLNNNTGERFSMLDLASASARNRFYELYWVVKNFE